VDHHEVAVALSGGVDSLVAAGFLVQQGWRLLGVHLLLAPPKGAAVPLMGLVRHLGIPLSQVDLRQDFAREVLDYFMEEYSRGRTPNPCVQCNATIKFGRLWEELKQSGVPRLATGHYARLLPGPEGTVGLYRGVDRLKDQSYFLSRLPRELLPHLLFPLGEMTKKEVHRKYREMGLPLRERYQDSQELCFVSEGRYHKVIRERWGSAGSPGEFVDTQDRVLGRHRGLTYYTVGQRRGLGIPSTEPYYVVAIRPETNRVVLGRRPELLAAGLLASRVNWLIPPPEGDLEAQAVIRYRHPGVLAQVTPLDSGAVQVMFATPQAAVAPGQAVVLYRDDQVLGSAWIEARIT
jgi:tRNA-specific 2-thiouridylase